MSKYDFKPGDLVAYVPVKDGKVRKIEIGVFKRFGVYPDTAFVYYSPGDTSAATDVDDLMPVQNYWVVDGLKERMEELKNENI